MDDQIHSLAQELYQQKSLLVMGRGYNYATCLEGALVTAQSLFYSCSTFNKKSEDLLQIGVTCRVASEMQFSDVTLLNQCKTVRFLANLPDTGHVTRVTSEVVSLVVNGYPITGNP